MKKLWIFVLIAFSSQAHALEETGLLLDVPLVDMPFNATDGSYQFPSMRQSLQLSTDFVQGVHFAIAPDGHPKTWQKLAIGGVELLGMGFPLSSAWMHEEWHRAVMSHRNIRSFNDTYNFPIFSSLIAVSHVSDDDLARLKRDFPADQVRMQSAGIEAQYEQNLLIESRLFFRESRSWDKISLWFNHLNSILYLSTCADARQSASSTDSQNEADGRDLLKRDFTGLDCNGWVYDLYRPDEPYAARGVHPSGVGINRYRRFSDLNGEEQDFLKLQSSLAWLNLVDPFLFGIDEVQSSVFGFGERWNATLRHHITSFGYSVEGNLFVQHGEQKWLMKLHNYFNAVRYFPGLSLELRRWLIHEKSGARLSAKVQAWAQPESQRVKSTTNQLGGLLSATVAYPISSRAETYVGFDAKTDGWVAGNVYLEKNLSLFAGATFLFE